MAQDGQQLGEEVAALMKARREIDSKLDAAQEKRAGWRDGEDEKRTRSIKRESEERDGDWRGESVATRSPSV